MSGLAGKYGKLREYKEILLSLIKQARRQGRLYIAVLIIISLYHYHYGYHL